jgi:hypothetical protein
MGTVNDTRWRSCAAARRILLPREDWFDESKHRCRE